MTKRRETWCPYCEEDTEQITQDSRPKRVRGRGTVRRRKFCTKCKLRHNTLEIHDYQTQLNAQIIAAYDTIIRDVMEAQKKAYAGITGKFTKED